MFLILLLILNNFVIANTLDSESLIDLQNKKMSEYQSQLLKTNSQIKTLSSQISKIEQDLGEKNQKYLEQQDLLKKLREQSEHLQAVLSQHESDYIAIEKGTKSVYRNFVASSLELENSQDLVELNILKKTLEHYLNKLKNTENQKNQLHHEYSIMISRLNEYEQNSQSLYSLLIDLEDQKKELAHTYMNEIEQKKSIEGKVSKVKFSILKEKVGIKELFSPPLKSFTNYKSGKKGITFEVGSDQPVYAPGSGKVVYTGELSTYGNVIMIDHGKDIRSVVLGDMKIAVTNGDQIKSGDRIALIAPKSIKANLYFEVRKENIVQDTLQWIDKKQL